MFGKRFTKLSDILTSILILENVTNGNTQKKKIELGTYRGRQGKNVCNHHYSSFTQLIISREEIGKEYC